MSVVIETESERPSGRTSVLGLADDPDLVNSYRRRRIRLFGISK
jgi:hypothetical protein